RPEDHSRSRQDRARRRRRNATVGGRIKNKATRRIFGEHPRRIYSRSRRAIQRRGAHPRKLFGESKKGNGRSSAVPQAFWYSCRWLATSSRSGRICKSIGSRQRRSCLLYK